MSELQLPRTFEEYLDWARKDLGNLAELRDRIEQRHQDDEGLPDLLGRFDKAVAQLKSVLDLLEELKGPKQQAIKAAMDALEHALNELQDTATSVGALLDATLEVRDELSGVVYVGEPLRKRFNGLFRRLYTDASDPVEAADAAAPELGLRNRYEDQRSDLRAIDTALREWVLIGATAPVGTLLFDIRYAIDEMANVEVELKKLKEGVDLIASIIMTLVKVVGLAA